MNDSTDFNSTQFSETSTEWSDFNKEISSVVQAWDDYFFFFFLVHIYTNKREFI